MSSMPSELPKSVAGIGSHCCGCGACAAVCPKGCISRHRDEMGFPVFKVDEEACISCGACVKVCPVYSLHERQEVQSCQWMVSRDAQTLGRSSSGGVFSLLAGDLLADGGTVYGARLSSDCKSVFHARVDDARDLDALRGSKYVQSVIPDEIYSQVASDLRSGKRVLWTGVPCQAAACRAYLTMRKIDTTNLLCVDVICHGVPSPEVWRKWIEHKEAVRGSEVEQMAFRDKATGWPKFSMSYRYADGGAERGLYFKDWYYKAFGSDLMLRESCFDCPSKRSSGSDITIGDFWGFQQAHPEIDHTRGVSAVIANTAKGNEVLERICALADCGPSSYNEIYAGNPSLEVCPKRPQDWEAFRQVVTNGASIPTLVERWSFKRPKAALAKDAVVGVIKKLLGPKRVQALQAKRFEARKAR